MRLGGETWTAKKNKNPTVGCRELKRTVLEDFILRSFVRSRLPPPYRGSGVATKNETLSLSRLGPPLKKSHVRKICVCAAVFSRTMKSLGGTTENQRL